MTDTDRLVPNDDRKPWTTPLVIGTLPSTDAEVGSVRRTVEGVLTSLGSRWADAS
jgi:hypothetical protein